MPSDQPPLDGPPLLGAQTDPLIGATLADRYRITSRLGDGGMGAVYLAEHTALGRLVALKLLKPEFNGDASLVERFFREARATAAIEHENVVDILDFGKTEQYAFFAMEALSGCELADLLRNGKRLAWSRVKPITVQIVRALAAAHAAGIVHRDMKPGNVFLIRRGDNGDFVKVLDFGIAKIDDGVQLTQAGMVFGTAAYMAPEQATGGEVDGRTDIYAVGCMLFEMLTGRLPFCGDNFMKVLAQHLHEAPPRLHAVVPDIDVPPELEPVLNKMLGKLPNERYASMTELEQALMSIPSRVAFAEQHDAGPPRVDTLGVTDPTSMLQASHAPVMLEPPPIEPSAPAPATARAPAPAPAPAAETAIPPLLSALAYLFVAFAHGTDGVLTPDELRVLSARLRDWVPDLALEQIGQVLRDAVAGYRQVPDKPAQLRAARAALAHGVGTDRRPQIITDLHAIAVADGRFDIAEQEFIEATSRSLGLAPEPMVRSLAIIYLALAHAADGEIDAQELRVVAERLQQWAPHASLVEIGAVLRDAVAEYKQLHGAGARLDQARAAADALKLSTPRETLRRILADLWRIAGSDGHISPEEQRFITEMVGRFNA